MKIMSDKSHRHPAQRTAGQRGGRKTPEALARLHSGGSLNRSHAFTAGGRGSSLAPTGRRSFNERMANLESQLSAIAGVPVEITIRGLREFTFSFESVNQSATDAIVNFFGSQALVKVETDNECGTFIYATV